MNREKQIEEMGEIIENNLYQYGSNPYPPEMTAGEYTARELIARGYRKMNEVTLRLDLGDRSAEEIKQIADAFNGDIKKQVAKEIIDELKGDMAIATFTFNSTLASELKTIYLRLQKEYEVED